MDTTSTSAPEEVKTVAGRKRGTAQRGASIGGDDVEVAFAPEPVATSAAAKRFKAAGGTTVSG